MPAGELHIELSANYAEDPKVRRLLRHGRDARACRDLYVQMACYCKRNTTDGFVPAEEIGLLVYPDTPENGERDAGRLVDAELVDAVDGGYFVRAYPKRNPTRAELEQRLEDKATGGAWGNHRRWHAFKGITKPDCRYCQSNGAQHPEPDEPSVPESHSDRSTDSDPTRAPSREQSLKKEKEKETENNPPTPQGGKRGSRRAEYDYDRYPDFKRFWAVYPEKAGKANACKAWLDAIDRGQDPEVIIKAAEQYRNDPRRNPDKTKHPQGWLNAERYLDEAGPEPSGQRPFWEN